MPETVRPDSPSSRTGWPGGLVAVAALTLCSMVAIAAAISPSDQATAPAAGEVTRALAFTDRLPSPEIAASEIAEVEPPTTAAPSEAEPPPPQAAVEADALARTQSRRRTRAIASSGSQFLAVLAQRPPSREPGTLVARARGGSCRFWIDGVMSGEGRVVRIPAKPGPHNVACRSTVDGRPHVQRVQVAAGGIAVAAFHL